MPGDDDEERKRSSQHIAWGGEKEGYRVWYKLVYTRCRLKKGLVKRIVCSGLLLEDFKKEEDNSQEDETAEDLFDDAEAWIYNLVGTALSKNDTSTAYSLFDSVEIGAGSQILKDFQEFFDGSTEEEIEDLEDAWKLISFASDGVTGLATYMSKHANFVRRLNQDNGTNISQSKAFRRVLKQLPPKYISIRQSLSNDLDQWTRKEIANISLKKPLVSVQKEVLVGINDLKRRLYRFNHEEEL